MPSIILTRPIAQSQRFANEISCNVSTQVEVLISPLLRIYPIKFSEPSPNMDVVFTSENGVAGFVAGAKTSNRRAFCVGDKTAQAARDAGFRALSAGGTAHDLVELIAREGGGAVIYARGEHISRDLMADLSAIGIPVHEVIVYSQKALTLNNAARTLICGSEKLIFPLFSKRSMRLLVEQDVWGDRSNLSAVCISKAVADAAAPEMFDEVAICQEPTSPSMIASLRTVIA